MAPPRRISSSLRASSATRSALSLTTARRSSYLCSTPWVRRPSSPSRSRPPSKQAPARYPFCSSPSLFLWLLLLHCYCRVSASRAVTLFKFWCQIHNRRSR
eukprot:Mycagemm_TRINITY_DN10227_c0_g1::TRINITY_DN10227_c0_g1_i1::g.4352::m.4352 type:complete len:101 gc:universal TRINITY_DN10227_c0_g1_i1:109-411(+)